MKKLLLLCVIIILLFGTTGCLQLQEIANESTPSQQAIPNVDSIASQAATASENIPSLQSAAVSTPLEGNVYNDDGSIKIDVYVNDSLMDVKVFDDNPPPVEGPNNLSNFTLADPIMSFLGIEHEINETDDTIRLTSTQYGEMEFSYSEDVRIIEGEVYLQFYDFRVYTNGSLKQNDYDSMYLYTGDYERTDLPSTLEECYAMLDEMLSPEEIEYMKNASDEDLAIQYSMGLGLWIRNNWLYPTQSKLTELLFENGVSSIDSMSWIILAGYVKHLNGEPCSLADLIGQD